MIWKLQVLLLTCCRLGQEKKKLSFFSLPDRPYFITPDPTDYIGKLVDTELKGRYKTVKPPNGDCKSAGHWTVLVENLWKGWEMNISTNVFMK